MDEKLKDMDVLLVREKEHIYSQCKQRRFALEMLILSACRIVNSAGRGEFQY